MVGAIMARNGRCPRQVQRSLGCLRKRGGRESGGIPLGDRGDLSRLPGDIEPDMKSGSVRVALETALMTPTVAFWRVGSLHFNGQNRSTNGSAN
jgi:hypothetical protein